MLEFHSSKERLPGYLQPVKRSDQTYVVISGGALSNSTYGSTAGTTAADEATSRISWAGVLTPYIERGDIWDDLRDGTIPAGREVRLIELYQCPADTDLTSLSDNAGMSYIANTGAWDYDAGTYLPLDETATPPTGDTKANGLFFNRVLGLGINVRISGIRDGAATTLMLSENVHKNENYSWLGVGAGGLGEHQFGMVWITGADSNTPLNDAITQADSELSSAATADKRQAPFSFAPGVEFYAGVPGYVRPASNHAAGTFNVIFADNHGLSLNAELDYIVYQQLMTPNGRKCVDPFNHDGFGNEPMTNYLAAPPVSEADFQ